MADKKCANFLDHPVVFPDCALD